MITQPSSTHASYRRQKNIVRSHQVDHGVISDHAAMVVAAFHHFEGLLGTSVDQELSLDLEFLGLGAENLLDLKRGIL
jgi:hypothetical protein